MQKNTKTFLLNNLYPLLLLLLSLIVSILNYEKGTFLTGFDSLHNEFNLILNIKRNFLGVWQTHQGLGLLGGMSHLSDIPRMIILLLLSLVFPMSFLRYAWTFLMLIIGPIGVYFFSLKFLRGEDSSAKKPASFLAGAFYIFNLSTLQLFYSNFDGFVTHYGFIPWLFLTAYLFLTGGNKKHLLYFLALSILSANQAYTGTLFFSFALFLSVFLFTLFFQNIRTIPVKRLAEIIVFWVGINLFWMLPVGHFILTSSEAVPEASINLMSSEESYFMNRKYGDIVDVLTLKNFWFDLADYDSSKGSFIPLLSSWESYLEGKTVILYIFSSFVVIGFFSAILKREYRSIALLFLVSVFFLMAGKGFLGGIFIFFQKNVPLFKEALRFPFTKFSVLASFTYSLLIAIFFTGIFNIIKRLFGTDKYSLVVTAISFSLLSYVFYPYFKGKLINPNMRVAIPKDYFEMYSFFDSRPENERIYLMPSNTFWAWEYYNWGYRGSGFVWYGMKQPVLARAFDVWNRNNEKVFWEVSYAISSRDPEILNAVLNKYNIKWLLFDGSRIYPENEYSNNYSTDTKEYLDSLKKLGKVVIGSQNFGFLTAYETGVETSTINYSDSILPSVSTYQGLSNYDPAYLSMGDYISNEDYDAKVFYPYSYLSSVRSISIGSNNSNLLPLYKPGGNTFSFVENEVPYTVSLQTNADGFKVLANQLPGSGNNILIEASIPLNYDDGILFLGNYYEASEALGKDKKGLLTFGGSSKYLRIYRTKSESPLSDFITSRPQVSTCSEVESDSYTIEYRENSYFLESYGDNPSVCMYTGLSIKPDSRYLRVLYLHFDPHNSVGRVCFLDKEDSKCVYSQNFFQPGDYAIPLLNLKEGKDYFIYFYSYPLGNVPMSLRSYSSEFSDLHIKNKELIFEKELIGTSNFISTEDIDLGIDLKSFENKTYVYNNNDLAKLFRSCGGNGEKIDIGFVNEREGIIFPIPADRSLCLTILTDSMLPYHPFSGIVEIEYEVSEKGQNVYVFKDNLLTAVDKFEKSNPAGRLTFPIINAESLSVNVELVSPGSKDNFLKVKSIRVVPLDLKEISYSKISANNFEAKAPSLVPLANRGENFVYKLKDVNKGAIILDQSYSKDWLVLCSNLNCDPMHYELNGWQNIWNIEELSRIVYIIYVPQFLGFIGLLISLSSLIITFLDCRKKKCS